VRTTDSPHDHLIAPNRLGRAFAATVPARVWLAYLTYIRTGEGWLFLAALIDMHTRKIVGWSMRETLHGSIAVETLRMAVARQRPPAGLIHHSDSQRVAASSRGVCHSSRSCVPARLSIHRVECMLPASKLAPNTPSTQRG